MSSALLLQLCHSPPKALGSTRKLHPCENRDGDLKSAGLGGGEEGGRSAFLVVFALCIWFKGTSLLLSESHISTGIFQYFFFFVLDDAAL